MKQDFVEEKVTLVDKANVLETSRLLREIVQKTAHAYPLVDVEYLFVDNVMMQIIQRPNQFDVFDRKRQVFGDIISDETSVITGSIGLLPSASVEQTSLFEPIHGSYPEATGKDIANPIATILSAAMLLDSFDMFEEAKLVRNIVKKVIDKGLVTQDLNPDSFIACSKVGDVISLI